MISLIVGCRVSGQKVDSRVAMIAGIASQPTVLVQAALRRNPCKTVRLLRALRFRIDRNDVLCRPNRLPAVVSDSKMILYRRSRRPPAGRPNGVSGMPGTKRVLGCLALMMNKRRRARQFPCFPLSIPRGVFHVPRC